MISADANYPLAALHSMWPLHMAHCRTAMDNHVGVSLAELLWRIGGHGDSQDITHVSVEPLRWKLDLFDRRDSIHYSTVPLPGARASLCATAGDAP